jgi:hypothetical protein
MRVFLIMKHQKVRLRGRQVAGKTRGLELMQSVPGLECEKLQVNTTEDIPATFLRPIDFPRPSQKTS